MKEFGAIVLFWPEAFPSTVTPDYGSTISRARVLCIQLADGEESREGVPTVGPPWHTATPE